MNVLLGGLQNKTPAVRYLAASSASRVGAKAGEAVPGLLKMLHDPDPRLQNMAMEALGKIGPDARKAGLAELAKDRPPSSSPNSTNEREPDPADGDRLPTLIQDLKDEDLNVRLKALRGLGKLGPAAKEAVPAMVAAMKADNQVAFDAVEALGNIGPGAKEAVPALIDSLQDTTKYLRERAAEALGKIGPGARTAVGPLEKALKDEGTNVRLWASFALIKITGNRSRYLPLIKAVYLDKTPSDPFDVPRAVAIMVLEELGQDAGGAVPELTEALTDTESAPVTPERAARALGNIGPDAAAAVPRLIELAKTSRAILAEARVEAIKTLGKIGPAARAAIPTLTELADDRDPSVAGAAAESLRTIIGKEVK